MIPERHINKEEFLGLGGTVIPWEYFKGINNIDGMVFTDDPYLGVQFYYSEKDKGCYIVGAEKTQYVTKEDLENCRWIIIGNTMTECSTLTTNFEGYKK